VVKADAGQVAALRRRLDEAGLYGRRVHVVAGDPAEMRFPPYLASRIEVEAIGDEAGALAQKAFASLRPYGGEALIRGTAAVLDAIAKEAGKWPGAKVEPGPGTIRLIREGALQGSAAWTHHYGDVANSVVSADELVKPPLGLLWFGGPSNDDILPRHGHGPSPQVVGGRLFIEGPDALRAVDVYTS
jgi:hypothetical protein